jgi:hypothetical protein
MEPIGTGVGADFDGRISTGTSVTTKGITGPSTTMIGSGELPADGLLDDVAPAVEVLEAALARGAWTRVTCTW